MRVAVTFPGFRPRLKFVLTTRLDRRLPKDEIASLYRRRWHVELFFRSIKVDLGMGVLRGRTAAMVRREIFVHLLGYNVVRALMLEAAKHQNIEVEKISFRAALDQLSTFRQLASFAADQGALLVAIIEEVGRHRVGNRPDRYEPRAIKRQRGRYRTMIVPRKQARKRLWKRTK